MFLNLPKSVIDLMFWGRLFHNFGAIFQKLYHQMSWISHVFQREDFLTVNEDCD